MVIVAQFQNFKQNYKLFLVQFPPLHFSKMSAVTHFRLLHLIKMESDSSQSFDNTLRNNKILNKFQTVVPRQTFRIVVIKGTDLKSYSESVRQK